MDSEELTTGRIHILPTTIGRNSSHPKPHDYAEAVKMLESLNFHLDCLEEDNAQQQEQIEDLTRKVNQEKHASRQRELFYEGKLRSLAAALGYSGDAPADYLDGVAWGVRR